MAIPNVNAITSTLRTMSDQQLQQYAMLHKNDPYILPMAVSESNSRKQMRSEQQGLAAGQHPQPKVAEADIAGMAQQPQMAPQGQLPEQQGIGALPAPNMQHMADGGIAGYADGGMDGGNQDANLVYNNEPAMRMAGGGAIRFADRGFVNGGVSGDIPGYVPNPNNFIPQVGGTEDMPFMQRKAREAAEAIRAGTATPQQKAMVGWANRLGLGTPEMAPAPEARPTQSPESSWPTAKAAPEANTKPPVADQKPPIDRRALANTPAAPTAAAAPEQSAAERYAAMQKEMGGGDRKELDARQAALETSMAQGATDRQAALEADIASRGQYGEAKEARLAAREEGLGKEKDQMSGLALIEAGLGIMSTPGTLAMAIGKGAKEGLKTYGEGLAKLKAAQERIDDARDQMDEFRRTEANMTAKERRDATNDISKTQTDIKQLGMQAAEKMYGYKRDDTKAVFGAETQERLTGQEIAGRKDVATMQERGANARANAQIAATLNTPERQMWNDALKRNDNDTVAAFKELQAAKAEKFNPYQSYADYLKAFAGKDGLTPPESFTKYTSHFAPPAMPKPVDAGKADRS